MGFETVVRPSVFPDIRPAPARTLPAPGTGSYATIRGNGGKTVNLTNSYSASASTSNKKETQRRVDEVRMYQKSGTTGKVNRNNYVDFQVANKVWMNGGSGKSAGTGKSEAQVFGGVGIEKEVWNFGAFNGGQDSDAFEIRKRNQIVKARDQQ